MLLTKSITLIVLDYYVPLFVNLINNCICSGGLISGSIVFPNPTTIGSSIHIIIELYEQY